MNAVRPYSDHIVTAAALLLWLSLLFVPAAAGTCIVLLLAAAATGYKPMNRNKAMLMAVTCFTLLFILLLLQFPFAHDRQAQWFETEKKLSCIVLPLCFLLYRWNGHMIRRFLCGYNLLVAAVGLYCLLSCTNDFITHGDTAVFFYHRFGGPLQLHAVYFSLYITTAAASLAFFPVFRSKALIIILKLFFLVLILLLSSKLFLVLHLLLLGTDLLQRQHGYRRYWWLVLLPLPVLFLLGKMPVAQRFRDIQIERTGLLQYEQLSDSIYLDGLSFRLLQWKNGLQILQEQHALLSGVPAGDATDLYQQKIRAKKWYTGSDGRSGFLQYNMHNQYLETWIRCGLVGLLLLAGILGLLFYQAWRSGSGLVLTIFLLYAVFFCTESVLERQAGIIPFCFTVPLCIACGSRFPGPAGIKKPVSS